MASSIKKRPVRKQTPVRRTRTMVAVAAGCVALIATVAAAVVITRDGDASRAAVVQRISAAKALDVVATNGVGVIDVRTPAEFVTGHLSGARNIDVRSTTFVADVQKLDKHTTWVVYCHSGNRSRTASRSMQDVGFEQVYDVDGGVVALQAAGAVLVS